jgi:hypothetical protein
MAHLQNLMTHCSQVLRLYDLKITSMYFVSVLCSFKDMYPHVRQISLIREAPSNGTDKSDGNFKCHEVFNSVR